MCSVQDCAGRVIARGLCNRHYKKLRRYGSPLMSGRPSALKRYRQITIWGHPLADKYGRALEHRVILYSKIGSGTHPCHWCGQDISWELPYGSHGRLTGDHLDWDIHNNDPDNLVAACNSCNAQREEDQDWEPWKPDGAHVAPERRQVACKRGHSLSGENVYSPPGQPDRRCCRECIRIRQRKSWKAA